MSIKPVNMSMTQFELHELSGVLEKEIRYEKDILVRSLQLMYEDDEKFRVKTPLIDNHINSINILEGLLKRIKDNIVPIACDNRE